MSMGIDNTRAASSRRRFPQDIDRPVQAADCPPLRLRSIRYSDVDALARFHATLSEETVRRRYFHAVGLHARIAPARLAMICRPDAESEAVLVAVCPGETPERDEVVAVGRLEQVRDRVGEVAILVADRWQHHGIGALLLDALVETGKRHGLARLNAYILRENEPMRGLCVEHGFSVTPTTTGMVRAELTLA